MKRIAFANNEDAARVLNRTEVKPLVIAGERFTFEEVAAATGISENSLRARRLKQWLSDSEVALRPKRKWTHSGQRRESTKKPDG
jgi:Zn-dependent peptidase ImmA (M78 family)